MHHARAFDALQHDTAAIIEDDVASRAHYLLDQRRHEDLAAGSKVADPRCDDHVLAEQVTRVVDDGLTGVQTHTHPDTAECVAVVATPERPLGGDGEPHGAAGA